MKKIVIINQPLNNRGDESAHKALVRYLSSRLSDAMIQIPYPANREIEMRPFMVKADNIEYISIPFFKGIIYLQHPLIKYNLLFLAKLHPALRKYCKLFRNSDWVVCAPGGICLGGFQNWGHLFFLLLAKYCNSKIAYYGRSIGPFPTITKKNREFKHYAVDFLSHVEYLSIRDEKSEEMADALGLKYYSTIDTAFLDYPETDIPKEITKEIGNSSYMVFVPNVLIWHYNYRGRVEKKDILDFYIQLVACIKKNYSDLKIVMLPQTYNPSNGDGDVEFFKELKNEIGDSNIIIVNEKYSSDIQQCIIRESRFVVGARYHSVVFAINNNVPFIALSYEHKISGLLKRLGKEDRMIDIVNAFDNNVNKAKALTVFNNLLHNLVPDKKAQTEAKQIAKTCVDKLVSLIPES